MKKPKTVRTTFGQYTIICVKGQGGSGIVYEASDDASHKFAIKAIDQQKATTDKLRRFKNEFSFCSRYKHANIITVSDHGITDEGNPFFVMPLYDGSLRDLVAKLEAKQVMNVFAKIMDGLEAAHKLGVVHRDIKPENILVREAGRELVLADFGIARFEQEELYTAVETRDGTRLANFQYAAPEQRARGKAVDHRADIYALGLILNELFTGEIPNGANFRRISNVTNDYPYLDEMVDKMLEQNPLSRFNDIEEIKRELKARGQEHVALQKISELEQSVIPASEVDDSIVRDPLRIVSVDWSDNVLTLEFNHPVNDTWQRALISMGNYSVRGKEPAKFRFKGSKATISAMSYEVQKTVDHFKEWLPKANKEYVTMLRRNQKAEERKQREQLETSIRKQKERAEVLTRLKL